MEPGLGAGPCPVWVQRTKTTPQVPAIGDVLGEAPGSSGMWVESPAALVTGRGHCRADGDGGDGPWPWGPGRHSSPEQQGQGRAKGLRPRVVGNRTQRSREWHRGEEVKSAWPGGPRERLWSSPKFQAWFQTQNLWSLHHQPSLHQDPGTAGSGPPECWGLWDTG